MTETVDLTGGSAKDVEAALARPGIRSVRLLECKLGKKTLQKLGATRTLTALEILACGLGAGPLGALLEHADWPELARLDLRGNRLGEPGVVALGAASAKLPSLVDLGLFATRLTEPGIRALSAHRHIERWQSGSDDIGVAGARAIAANGWPLTHLRIARQPIQVAGVEALMERAPASLRVLVLYEAAVGPRAMRAIAAATAPRLEEARFRYDPIDDDAVAFLANAPSAAALTRLQISQARVGVDGVDAICRSPLPATIEELDLSTNPHIGVDGVRRVGATHWPRLRKLRIGGTSLGAAGIRALTSNELPALEELDVTNAQLDDHALADLAAWPSLGHVRRLCVGTSAITASGLAAFAQASTTAKIDTLDVSQSPCASTAADVLAAGGLLRPQTLHTSFAVR